MSDQPTPAPDEQEATILVGGMTREEFLGEPERYRERLSAASKPPVEDEG